MYIRFLLKKIYSSYYSFCRKIRFTPLKVKIEQLSQRNREHSEFLFFANYRKENETILDAKKRFFRSLKSGSQEIEKIQKTDLELLKKFVEICNQNNLTYFISYGSVLGLIRHGGFIPWDDDLDVSMPSNDLDKLIKIIGNNDTFRIVDYVMAYSNLRIFKFEHKNSNHVCYIDVFTYDELNINPKTALKIKNRFINKGRNKTIFSPSIRSVFKKHNIKYCSEIYRDPMDFTYDNYFNMLDKNIKKYRGKLFSKEDCKNKRFIVYDINMPPKFNPIKEAVLIYDFDIIFPLKTAKFCGVEVYIPNNCDLYLKSQYGNYYLLPGSFDNHSGTF